MYRADCSRVTHPSATKFVTSPNTKSFCYIYECWQAIISVKRIFSLSFTYITSYNTTLFIISDHFTKMRLRWFSLIFGEATNLVRLACVRHAASVRPEPGSNSRLIFLLKITLSIIFVFHYFVCSFRIAVSCSNL